MVNKFTDLERRVLWSIHALLVKGGHTTEAIQLSRMLLDSLPKLMAQGETQ